MRYLNLGRSSIRVSRLCLGCMGFGDTAWRGWVLNEDDSRPIIRAAFEAGINFFDTADAYSSGASETIVGKVLSEIATRDEYVLATKVSNPLGGQPSQRGLSRKQIMNGIDASLQRLGVDHVDLCITHRWDIATPIAETMEALNDVVKAGKARHIGASSIRAWQFAKAQYLADLNGWQRFVSVQNHYNLIYREEERETIPQCRDMGVALTPASPLARGFLAGNRHRQGGGDTLRARSDNDAHCMYYAEADFDAVEALAAMAEARGLEPAQLALSWMLHKPAITAPIIGVSSTRQLTQLVGALDFDLVPEEIRAMEELYYPRTILSYG